MPRRPPGSKDVIPAVRDLVNSVKEGKDQEIRAALERVATSPRTVLAFLDLAAKLNREIGPGAVPLVSDEDRPVKITLKWPDA